MYWSDAERQLELLGNAICCNDFASADSVLHTIKGASSALGYDEVASAAEAARAILGLQPGFDPSILRKTMAVTFSADPPAASRGVIDGASPIIAAAHLDQYIYWQMIRMQTVVPQQEGTRH